MIHAEVRALVSVVNIAAVTAGDRERERDKKAPAGEGARDWGRGKAVS